MIIEKILKQLTPERIEKEIKAIQEVKLPPELQKWVKEYEKVGDRDEFIWKWSYIGLKKLTLPSVSKKYRNLVLEAKFISIVLNVLLDDLADKRKNKNLLEKAINICILRNSVQKDLKLTLFDKEDQSCLDLIREIWLFLNRTIKRLPRYKEFRDIFLYDYQQFLNSVRYGYLINKNLNLINIIEDQIYSSHNMQGMIMGTMDLMASLKFNINELGLFREIIWRAQRMGRIGNSLTTWKREILENDFSSEIFGYALINGILSQKDLRKENSEEIVKKIEKSDIKNYFLNEWEKRYKEIREFNKEMKSFNFKEVLEGLESLIVMHFCSVGFK